jgi:hypothetical protein
MSQFKLRRPTTGTVLGLLALIVAVGGSTQALSATKKTVIVRKGEIAKGAVTAKNLAPGAVHPAALSAGAVHAAAIAGGAVGPGALSAGSVGPSTLAPDAVTAGAIAPGSVYGGALGAVTLHGASIADLDQTADLSTWTSSNTVAATCAPGERVMSGGVVFLDPGNRRVGIIQSAPVVNGGAQGWVGQITSDSGGTATAEVQVLCLK